MEKLVKLNKMRLEVLKKCLYKSHHLWNTVGVQTGLQESVSWRLLDCEDSFSYPEAATSSLFTCKYCGRLMTFFGHIVVSCHCLLWPQRLKSREDEYRSSKANKMVDKEMYLSRRRSCC